jgi:hypothetical protein
LLQVDGSFDVKKFLVLVDALHTLLVDSDKGRDINRNRENEGKLTEFRLIMESQAKKAIDSIELLKLSLRFG